MTRGAGPVFGLVAAAGSGLRFGAQAPKQYVPLAGRPMITYAIEGLAADGRVRSVMVVLPPGDPTFARFGLRFDFDVRFAEGGG